MQLSRAEPEPKPEKERERRAKTQNGKTSVQEDEGKLELKTKASPCNSLINTIEDIQAEHTLPGLHPHEISFLRSLEKLCDDCSAIINKTSTKLKFESGTILSGGQ